MPFGGSIRDAGKQIYFSAFDQAVQETASQMLRTHKSYQERLSNLQLQGSHSRKGNCLDNTCVESFFSHLKTEVFLRKSTMSKDETSIVIEEHTRFYNTERLQKRLGQLSPVEYREKLAA